MQRVPRLPPSCSSVTSAAMGTATVKTAADAGPAAGRICARNASMIETTEGVGMNTVGCAARKSAGVTETAGTPETRMVDAPRSAIEMTVIAKGSVVIDESRTVGEVRVVVVFHIAVMPVGAPMV